MSTELIINANGAHVAIALLEDGKLMEYQTQDAQSDFLVGDIYVGRIRKVIPGLNSTFVDIGHEKDAFLHYNDLGPQIKSLLKYIRNTQSGNQKSAMLDGFKMEPNIEKNGKIADIMPQGTPILVQITKEAISTKGPRLTSEVSIPGRMLVLVPFNDKVAISQKIKRKEERDRLRMVLDSMRPKGFGLIARTNSMGQSASDLKADLDALVSKWELTYTHLKSEKVKARVLSEEDKISGILRDLFSDSFTSIVVDDESLFLEISNTVASIAPGRDKIVKLHTDSVPIFEKYGVDRQVKTSFGRSVPMTKGAYLVIEHTEALHVIDVNSGNRLNAKEDQENNSLEVNLVAAKEIARQLRLRDMGGIIVVDFIDMMKSEHRKILYEKLCEFMKTDRARHKVLPPSKFGLIQITRQRVRPATDIETAEPNPEGTGETITAPINIINEINEALEQLVKSKKYSSFTLHAHPFVAAFLTKGIVSIRTSWFFKYGKWIKIVPRDAFKYLQYGFFDSKGKMIK
ncbi:MAG: Rne/Rng family ribonuclease [Flavobacteriales bacterium]|nr:Rne/Rng family ribonuclease [Flavobacteriales bacterium]